MKHRLAAFVFTLLAAPAAAQSLPETSAPRLPETSTPNLPPSGPVTVPAPLPPTPVMVDGSAPQSIWQGKPGADVRHTLSHLQCPLTLGDFLRTEYRVMDRNGFRVACTYDNRPGAMRMVLTLMNVNAAEFEQNFIAMRDSFIATQQGVTVREVTLAPPSALNWKTASFTTSGGVMDFYGASLSGWVLGVAVFHGADTDAQAAKAAAQLALEAERSAGPHLSACLAAPKAMAITARAGKRISVQSGTDEASVQKLAISGALLSKALLLPDSKAKAPDWCAMAGFNAAGADYTLWRNIDPPGDDGGLAERITSVRDGGNTTYVVADLSGGKTMANSDGIFALAVDSADQVTVHGFFDGRPSLPDIGRLTLSGGTVGVYARIIKTDGKVTVYKPF